MSFSLELPRVQAGTPEQQIAEITRYLHETAAQLNYALGFLDLPGATGTAAVNTTDPGVTTISEKSTNAQQPSAAAVYNFVNGYAVPTARTVNGHPLTEDVTLTPEDLNAVPATRTVNGHDLSANVTLTAADVNAVPETRAVNGHDLTEDVTLTAGDLGADDYVTETGETNGWTWRKWASNTVEMWATGLSVPLNTASAWTSELVYQNGVVTFPFTLAAAPHVQMTVTRAGNQPEVNGILLIAVKTESNATIRFVRKAAYGSVYLDVYVIGTAAAADDSDTGGE